MKSIVKVTKGDADLIVPPNMPEGEVWRYGLAIPFQVAPRKAALFVNIRKEYVPPPEGDFEAGTDVVLFDDLSKIRADEAIPVSRNHVETNPFTKEPSIMVKYPVIGGFVPLGAKRTDGSQHPHAGTGFGVSQACSFNIRTQRFDSDASNAFQIRDKKEYRYLEVYQFAYDGETFRILSKDRFGYDTLSAPGLTNAIPDGDDLLCAMSGHFWNAEYAGVARWRRGETGWHRVSYSPVMGTDGDTEPSLIRDVDGALLFYARNMRKDLIYHTRVWRSYDGVKWEQIIKANRLRAQAPTTINQAADGTPYIVANLHQEGFKDSRGIVSCAREILCIWPLNAERNGLEPGIIIRSARADFGDPSGGTYWMVDHPSATTLHLANGAWHNVLAYRIAEVAEIRWHGGGPTPQTGCYVEEVSSAGKEIPVWNF